MAEVFEYRGVEGLVIAEVTGDDNEEGGGYTTGDVESLAPTAEVNKAVETSSETRYYDNQAMLNNSGEGSDTIGIICAGLPLKKLAWISGRSYDAETGALIEGPRATRYFAVGYKTKDTDGFFRYVWRYKGTFNVPDEAFKTEDAGTETSNTALTYTGIYTTHKFTKGVLSSDGKTWTPAPAKGLVVSDREGLANLTDFFKTVTTPDTLTKAGTT